MNARSRKTLGLEIVAALCMVLGSIAVVDMGIKLVENVLCINFLALFLVVGVILWRRVRANQPPKRILNGKQCTAVAVGTIALLLTCVFPPFVKMTVTGFSPWDQRIAAAEFYGYDFVLGESGRRRHEPRILDEGSRVVFEFAFGILEWEWLAVASIAAVAFLLLQSRSNPGRGQGDRQHFRPPQAPRQTGHATDVSPSSRVIPA